MIVYLIMDKENIHNYDEYIFRKKKLNIKNDE